MEQELIAKYLIPKWTINIFLYMRKTNWKLTSIYKRCMNCRYKATKVDSRVELIVAQRTHQVQCKQPLAMTSNKHILRTKIIFSPLWALQGVLSSRPRRSFLHRSNSPNQGLPTSILNSWIVAKAKGVSKPNKGPKPITRWLKMKSFKAFLKIFMKVSSVIQSLPRTGPWVKIESMPTLLSPKIVV